VGIIHDEVVYMFGILKIEHNNSLEEVEDALVHLDKIMMSSIADPVI
jgi:hypothetical protein